MTSAYLKLIALLIALFFVVNGLLSTVGHENITNIDYLDTQPTETYCDKLSPEYCEQIQEEIELIGSEEGVLTNQALSCMKSALKGIFVIPEMDAESILNESECSRKDVIDMKEKLIKRFGS